MKNETKCPNCGGSLAFMGSLEYEYGYEQNLFMKSEYECVSCGKRYEVKETYMLLSMEILSEE